MRSHAVASVALDPLSPLAGQNVLVTGGTGSFGTAFVKRALADGARRVVVYSRGEAKQAAMRAECSDPRLRFFIGDVRSQERIYDACRSIDVLVHASALKRVEICEQDPFEAVATNVIGTQNVARACIERGVHRAILLSTDKAAAPNTLYGATKLTAERLWLRSNVYAAGTRTSFAATRYGNVTNSTGSVLPLWRKQFEERGEILVTDPTMSRFWMPMQQAVDLVILALREMRSGEVFIPKCGSATVAELAHVAAPGATLRLIGPRPGEKLHEMLISEDEARHAYDAGSHYIIEPDAATWHQREPSPHPRVPDRFAYTSDTNPIRLAASDIHAMLAA